MRNNDDAGEQREMKILVFLLYACAKSALATGNTRIKWNGTEKSFIMYLITKGKKQNTKNKKQKKI